MQPINIAINGFGRIGRLFLRAMLEQKLDSRFRIKVIVDKNTDPQYLVYQLTHDTVYGRLTEHNISTDKNSLFINGKQIKIINALDNISQYPWKEEGIDYVLEASGQLADFQKAQRHIQAGARKVIISAIAKGKGKTIIMGINEEDYNPTQDHIISNSSCTTNCIAPIIQVFLREGFGIENVLTTTIHSYTSSQKITDSYLTKEWRAGRAAPSNIIPLETISPAATADVIPQIQGRIFGTSFRIPLDAAALVDFSIISQKQLTFAQLDQAMLKASQTYLQGILSYESDELVSSDIIRNPHSSVYDSKLTHRCSPAGMSNFFKIISWYDNEWGYVCRLLDLMKYMASKE